MFGEGFAHHWWDVSSRHLRAGSPCARRLGLRRSRRTYAVRPQKVYHAFCIVSHTFHLVSFSYAFLGRAPCLSRFAGMSLRSTPAEEKPPEKKGFSFVKAEARARGCVEGSLVGVE